MTVVGDTRRVIPLRKYLEQNIRTPWNPKVKSKITYQKAVPYVYI